MKHCVYLLKRGSVVVYVGYSANPNKRIKGHFAKDYDSWRIVCWFSKKAFAMQFESKLILRMQPEYNVAEKVERTLTKQAEIYQARRAQGFCACCSTPSLHYRCASCRAEQRERKQRSHGYSPKVAKGRGRPVIA